MREIRQSGSEGGARFNPSFLPLSLLHTRTCLSQRASEERRCFGVRAAERSVDAALVLPEEANPLPPNQHLNPLHCKP